MELFGTNGESVPSGDPESPKGKMVSPSVKETELTASDESWKSLWTTLPEDELEDGTNLPAGTDFIWQSWQSKFWFHPEKTVENPHWRKTLERLTDRMKQFQNLGKRFPVKLEQIQVPPIGRDSGIAPKRQREEGSIGFGMELDPVFLKLKGAVIPSFAFSDAAGRPIANSAGDPFPYRLGFQRTHFIKKASSEDLQLFSDAAKVLSILPPFVNDVIWGKWRQGFPLPEEGFDRGVWVDAVFETSWQKLPFSSLRASRKAVSVDGNSLVEVRGEGRFPRIPPIPAFRTLAPNVHGYPQRIWSELPDLLEASLQLIETILAIPEPVDEEPEPTVGLDVKPKGTGRPTSTEQLSPRQCKAILKRIANGETIAKIHRQGGYANKGIAAPTFRRQLERFFGVSGAKGLRQKAKELHNDILQKPSAKRP
jgi:hypothetical protein